MDPFDAVEAQPLAVRTLQAAAQSGRVASAYLFEGPGGVGKELAAVALARRLINPGGDPNIAARIDAGTHPDVRIFLPRDEGYGNLKVQTLREDILPVAQHAPFEASSTFLIFPRADVSFPEAYPGAANALLKTLEEPRPGVHFILLAERPDRLLTTIRSRCQRVAFGRLPAELLTRILQGHVSSPALDEPDDEEVGAVDPQAIGPAVALAAGRADRALRLATGGLARELLDLAMELDDVVSGPRPGDRIDLAERLANHDDQALALEAVTAFYRDVAAVALGTPQEQLAFPTAAQTLSQRAERIGARGASARAGMVTDTMMSLERNANTRVAMEALLFKMRGAR